VYAASTLLLPWLAGFDPFERGMFARLRAGDGVCESRRALWSNVLDLIALKPWLGWGWGELDYAHYVTLFDSVRFCAILDNAHNLPLHLAVELGVPVAVLVCSGILVWVWRRRPWREADPTRQMAWGILAVIGLHSMLEYPLWYGPFQMATGLCVMLLWRREKPVAGGKYVSNRPLAQVLLAPAAIILIAASLYAMWDYHRISQLYLAPQDRDAAYLDDTVGKARKSWLFSNQVEFAVLTTTPLDRSNAQWTFDTASALLHYSPEPRIIEKVIESAVMLGRDDEAMAHLARYRAAFPKEHAAWARGNARMPEMIDSLNQAK
jgi:Virulence factor membrane-bound polymerase, C-terminal/O-Antigen ligase